MLNLGYRSDGNNIYPLGDSSMFSVVKSYIRKQLKENTSDSRMSGKNVAMRNAVVVLSVVCAIALISISVIFVYHDSIFPPSSNSQIADLQNQIAQIQSQKTSLESQIADLQNQINSLNSQLAAAGTNNQVQVSGTVQKTQTGTIYYRTANESIRTSSPITDGKYSVLLVGGQSYDIYIDVYHSDSYYYKPDFVLYVPLGVTTFTADF